MAPQNAALGREEKTMNQKQNQKIQDAVKLYEDRQSRRQHPDGTFDNAGRWYPSAGEKCSCCGEVRGPSRSYPYSYMVHCRTSKHIEQLMDIPAGSIRAEINRRVREQKNSELSAIEYKNIMATLAVAA
jgi:hypothetical protein